MQMDGFKAGLTCGTDLELRPVAVGTEGQTAGKKLEYCYQCSLFFDLKK